MQPSGGETRLRALLLYLVVDSTFSTYPDTDITHCTASQTLIALEKSMITYEFSRFLHRRVKMSVFNLVAVHFNVNTISEVFRVYNIILLDSDSTEG